jgi:tetratricopeptide (TPR) repeat protein
MRKIFSTIILPFLLLIPFFSCLSIQQNPYEQNDIKNLASEKTKTANQFMSRYDYEKALQFYREALKYNMMVDNVSGVIRSRADIGKVFILQGKFDEALSIFEEGHKISLEDNRYKIERAYVLNAKGEAYYYLEDMGNAIKYFQMALALESSLGNQENQALIILNIAKVERKMGNHQRALDSLQKARRLLEGLYKKSELNNLKTLSLVYYSIGQSYSKLGNFTSAANAINLALEIDKLIENASGIADDYYALGVIASKTENGSEALKFYKKSRDIYFILDNKEQYAVLSFLIGEIYFFQGEMQKAYENYQFAFKLSENDKKREAAVRILQIIEEDETNEFFSVTEKKYMRNLYKKYIE